MKPLIFSAFLAPLILGAAVPVSSAPFVGGPASLAAQISRDSFSRFGGESSLVNLEMSTRRPYFPVPVNEWSLSASGSFGRLDPGIDSSEIGFTPAFDYNRFRGVAFSAFMPVSFGRVSTSDFTRLSFVFGAAFHPLVGKFYGEFDWSIAPSLHVGYADDDRHSKNGYVAGGALTNRFSYNFWLCTLGFTSQLFDSQNLRKHSVGNHSLLLSNEVDLSAPFSDHWIGVVRAGNEYGIASFSTRTVWHFGVGCTYRNTPTRTSLTDWFPSQVAARYDRREASGDFSSNEFTVQLTWSY